MTRYWIRVLLLGLLSVLPLEAKDSCVECHSALEGSLLTPTQAFSADVPGIGVLVAQTVTAETEPFGRPGWRHESQSVGFSERSNASRHNLLCPMS